jgi:hypothetical protein
MTSPATARPTPAAGSFSIIPGIAVSEDEVPRTTKSSVRSRRSKSNRRIPANRQIVPNPAKMKTAIMAQAVPTKSASAYNVASPNFATVNAMAPKAPIGANATTTCTTLNTSSLARSRPVRKPVPRSPRSSKPMPQSSASTSTWSTSPLAKAPTKLSGIMCWI